MNSRQHCLYLSLEILNCSISICHTHAKQRFSGVYWSQPVCLSVCICVQRTTFCQSTGSFDKNLPLWHSKLSVNVNL